MRRCWILTALVCIAVSAGCATTSFTSTWRSPDATPVVLGGKRVVAMVMSASDASRRQAEVALARALTAQGATGIPAHTINGLSRDDEAAAQARLEAEKIDGVVVMRAVGAQTTTTYSPGMWTARPYYRGFYRGYYRYGWTAVYEPGYLRTDSVVAVETLVYSLVQNELIWAAQSSTTNPSGLDRLVTEVAGKVSAQMRKDGLLR